MFARSLFWSMKNERKGRPQLAERQSHESQPKIDAKDLLPIELWFLIFSYLDLKGLLTINEVSLFFNTCTESIWQAKLSPSAMEIETEQAHSYQYTFFKKFKGEDHSFLIARSYTYRDGIFNPIHFINDHNNRLSSEVYENLSDATRAAKFRVALPSLGWGPSFILELNISKNEAERLAKELNQEELRSHIIKMHTDLKGNETRQVTLIYQVEDEFKELATIAATPKLN